MEPRFVPIWRIGELAPPLPALDRARLQRVLSGVLRTAAAVERWSALGLLRAMVPTLRTLGGEPAAQTLASALAACTVRWP